MNRLALTGILVAAVATTGCAEQKVAFRNSVPTTKILSPADGSLASFGEPIQFEGQVSDKQDESDALLVTWESSIDDVIDDDASDKTGYINFSSSLLSAGTHEITLTATDAEGESASTSVVIQVVGDGGGGDGGDPTGDEPTVTIDNPVDGAVILQSEPVVVRGLVWDENQDPGTLEATIVSGIDGGLWEGQPNEFGQVEYETTGLSVGTHTIRLDVLDEDGNRASDQVQVEVVADARPGVVIESPGDGEWYWNTDTIRFEGLVTDDITDAQDLGIIWESHIDGVFSTVAANPTGRTIVDTSLTAGFHTISLTAIDSDANESTYSMTLEVRDPLDHDGDLDGYTENEGDCDDYNPYVHPGAEEICDAYDNNCNGEINEDDADELEPNDSLDSATDLGRIDDGWIFGSAEVESAGITLHTEWDEDWIRFDAGDDFFIDNVNIDVSVGAFPHTGDYVIELYLLDESSTVPVDVDLGSGRLSVQFEGDPWDGGEDDFALRIYADDWPGGTCGRRFEVEIVDM